MSARVCSPPMDLTRNSDLIPSCPTSSSIGTNSLPTSATIPTTISPFCSSSSGSSVVDPTSATSRRNVSRNLFGSPDPRSAQFARDKIKEIRQADTKRWNFDFDRELPLDGRFKWVPVTTESVKEGSATGEKSSTVPAAYACHRLPFLASSSGSTSQLVRTSSISSSSTRSSNLDEYYYMPDSKAPRAKSPGDKLEPLLIVRPSVILPPSRPQLISVNQKAGPSLMAIEEDQQRTIKPSSDPNSLTLLCSNNNTNSIINRPSTSETSTSSPSTSSSKVLPTFKSPESTTESREKPEDVKCKVKVKSTVQSQPKISDFMKETKRKASPQTAPVPEKKAAL